LAIMQMPPPLPPQPLPPQAFDRRDRGTRSRWLPAAIIGAAILIAAGLVAGALILRGKEGGTAAGGTCQAWTETRLTLRAIPALPEGWNWRTPNIDTYIKIQNAPVGIALDLFEPKIAPEPADVAEAAKDYVAVRRNQIKRLTDRTYVPADGAAVDTALGRLNQLCGIHDNSQPA
jgi:hypothetical protein